MAVSNKKLLSWAPLIQAMKQSLLEQWGVKVQSLTPETRLKGAFYSLKREFPEFKDLSLLLTPKKGEYLIYHPSHGEQDAEREN